MEVSNVLGILTLNSNVTAVLIFVILFLVLFLSTRKPAGIPPGPLFTLPVIGDLPLLVGNDMVQTFRKLRKKHGDVFSFYLGKDLTIIINGYKLIHEAAVKKGLLFSDRHDTFLKNSSENRNGIVLANGPLWKEQRKFTHNILQEFGFGKSSFEQKILEEVKCFVEFLNTQRGAPINIRDTIHASVSNVLFSIFCGKHYKYEDEVYQDLLHRLDRSMRDAIQVSIGRNCFPFLQYAPGDPFSVKFANETERNFRNYFDELYEEHSLNFDPDDCRDLFDHFIKEIQAQQNVPDTNFTVDQLFFIFGDLFSAGSETTATALRWAVLYLLNYPEIQKKLQNDIDNIVPKNRLPNLNDKVKLPYVEAFTMEVLRFANIVPLAVPHAVTKEKDVMFNGYRLPKGTIVWFNLDSVLFDADIFQNPSVFNPGRFLDSDNNVIRPKELIPFGIGRRLCLGEAVAKMELFLFITTMIQKFEFKPSIGSSAPTMKGILGVTYGPQEYEVRAIPR